MQNPEWLGADRRQEQLDAQRYRYLRDSAGNQIMRKLMDESRPTEWDKIVDADIRAPTVSREPQA